MVAPISIERLRTARPEIFVHGLANEIGEHFFRIEDDPNIREWNLIDERAELLKEELYSRTQELQWFRKYASISTSREDWKRYCMLRRNKRRLEDRVKELDGIVQIAKRKVEEDEATENIDNDTVGKLRRQLGETGEEVRQQEEEGARIKRENDGAVEDLEKSKKKDDDLREQLKQATEC